MILSISATKHWFGFIKLFSFSINSLLTSSESKNSLGKILDMIFCKHQSRLFEFSMYLFILNRKVLIVSES